jgi:hypothetical protein
VVDAFVEALDLAELGFEGVVPEETGRQNSKLAAKNLRRF